MDNNLPASYWREADDPVAAARATREVITTIHDDLTRHASNSLPRHEQDQLESLSRRFMTDLQAINAWAADSAQPKGYLLGTEPRPYPQQGDIVQKMAWFAQELWRLGENIDRRLGARTEAAKPNDPEKLVNAAQDVIGKQPYLRHLYEGGRLGATTALLDDMTARRSRAKLRKKSPRAAAAADRSPRRGTRAPAAQTTPPAVGAAAVAAVRLHDDRPGRRQSAPTTPARSVSPSLSLSPSVRR